MFEGKQIGAKMANFHRQVTRYSNSVERRMKVMDAETVPQTALAKIRAICQMSQEAMDKKQRSYGSGPDSLRRVVAEPEPYATLWKEFAESSNGPASFFGESFRNCLFAHVTFAGYTFKSCDFTGSRWVFGRLTNCNCSGSDFSDSKTFVLDLISTDCSDCNFRGSTFAHFDPCGESDYSRADFSGARLESFHSLFGDRRLERASRFAGANMTGCQLILKKEILRDKQRQNEVNRTPAELRVVLEKIFSSEQLDVMKIDYGTPSHEAGIRRDREQTEIRRPTRWSRKLFILAAIALLALIVAFLFKSR
jgi:hypothetical protein